jgi:signal transduction histidine kinase
VFITLSAWVVQVCAQTSSQSSASQSSASQSSASQSSASQSATSQSATSQSSTQFSTQTARADSLEVLLSSNRTLTDSLKVQILCDLSKEYETRDAVRSLVNARKAMLLADSVGFRYGIAKSQLRMGIVMWTQGFYEESVEYNFKALRIWQDLKDTMNIAYSLGGIGANYRKLNNYLKAKDYYTQALTLSSGIGDKKGMESMLNNLGVLYFGEGKFDSALVYWQRALEIDVAERDSASIALVSANVAWAFNNQGNQEVALRFAEQALETAVAINDKRDEALAYHILAQIYLAMFNYPEAERYELRALAIAEELKNQEIMRWAFEMLSLIYERMNRPSDALRFYKEFKDFSDSMYTTETAERTAVLTTQFRDEERLKEIAQLRIGAAQESKLRNVLVMGLAAVIAMLLAVINRYQYQRKTEQELLRRQQILDEQSREIELANTQLGEQNQQLHNLNEERNEILGIVAHDLKNPIGAVRSYAEMMLFNEIPQDEIQRAGESIIQTSNRMLELVNNLLDANAIESGKIQFTPALFDAKPIVEMLVSEMTEKASVKDISLQMTTTNTAPTLVLLDESAFIQVFENILSNAIKYSPFGKRVWVRCGTAESLQNKASCVRIEIQDEGPGFTEEDKEKLFGKFARLSARPTGGEHSTGLGLSIVKKLVELMHGTVSCVSEEGKGATFILEFPLATSSDNT